MAVHAAFVVNMTTGLETGLFALLLTASAWLSQSQLDRRRWRGAGLAMALAILTRPEGALAALLILGARAAIGEWRFGDRRGLFDIECEDKPIGPTPRATAGLRILALDATLAAATVAGLTAWRMWM